SRGFHPWLLTVAPLGAACCSPSNSRRRPVGAACCSPSNSRGFHPWLLTVAPLGLRVVLRRIPGVFTPGFCRSPRLACGLFSVCFPGFSPLAIDGRPVGASCCSPSDFRRCPIWAACCSPLDSRGFSPLAIDGCPVGAACCSPSNSRGFHP